MLRHVLLASACLCATSAYAQDAPMGERISVIGGCHDCHTVGYNESGGQIDPAVALTGSQLGYQGPWGTTYAANLRLVAADMNEDEWVEYMQTIETRPPMPWFNLHHFTEEESRALHAYIASLGEPGDPAPEFVPPGETPQTPYVVMAPPAMPGE